MLPALLLLTTAAAAPQVSFSYDSTHLKGIYVDGACILGDDVRTNGTYVIGSADGSDAQGRSVISVGGSAGRMKSDDPAHIAGPPMRLTFQQRGAGKLGFNLSVGPVAQDFATISFPFDFGLKSMDRFAFDGNRYKLFCSQNDGEYKGSGNTFDFIQPKCEIRDIQQNLIGKVGGASTEAASSWAEVDGPYATVRVTVTSSTHYEKLVFMNHPGTHNLEFSFGQMRKGESASIAGEIAVTPKSGPSSWTYDAATEFNHQVGRAEADGWSARVGDDREKYLCFGPYATEIGSGLRIATFRLMLDNVTFDNAMILTIDVADAKSGQILAKRDLTRGDFEEGMRYQDFPLRFNALRGARLEFRTLWHGASYARQKGVIVSKA